MNNNANLIDKWIFYNFLLSNKEMKEKIVKKRTLKETDDDNDESDEKSCNIEEYWRRNKITW